MVNTVVSNKMTKSVVVAVQRMWQHPRYPKLARRTSKFTAHDETNACNIGHNPQSYNFQALDLSKIVSAKLARSEAQASASSSSPTPTPSTPAN